MNHQEWLKWRSEGLGASDAPIVMGVSPWTTRYQLWEQKVSFNIDEKDTFATKRGKDIEPVARQHYIKMTGTFVEPKYIDHVDLRWMKASFDGLSACGKKAVEIKTPGKDDHETALAGNVPEKYIPQLQHQMFVQDLKEMDYFSYHPLDKNCTAFDIKLLKIERDDKYIEQKLLPEMKDFWRRIVTLDPPSLSERDYISMENRPEWDQNAVELKKIRDLLRPMKELEKREAEIKDTLKKICNYKSSIGGGIKMLVSTCKGAIDHAKALQEILERYPEIVIDLEAYRKNSFTKYLFDDI